jgi:hypothetical protein
MARVGRWRYPQGRTVGLTQVSAAATTRPAPGGGRRSPRWRPGSAADRPERRVRAGGRPGHDGLMTEPKPRPAPHIVVVGPDGAPASPDGGPDGQRSTPAGVFGMVSQPDKVMRIGTMIKQLLEEVRAAPLDDASRQRLREIHQTSIQELCDGLAPELREELERLTLPFDENATPSDAELRIAQAQLVGWLEGLFHGIQTALFAQQMAARGQLEEIRRRALPPGELPGGLRGQPGPGGAPPSGPYL